MANSCHWLEVSSVFNFIDLLLKNEHGFVCLFILLGQPIYTGSTGTGQRPRSEGDQYSEHEDERAREREKLGKEVQKRGHHSTQFNPV